MTMVTAMIDRSDDLHHQEIVSSCSFAAFFVTPTATHHACMMSSPSGRGSMIGLADGLPS